jgi:hypothetical protein
VSASHLEARLAQLPKELETGYPPRIARLLGERLRQSFEQSGLPDTAKALDQSCSEMNSVQKQLVNLPREVAHPDIGVIAKVRSANDSLLRNMIAGAQQIDDLLGRLKKQVWAVWLPVVGVQLWHLASGWARGSRTYAKWHRRHRETFNHNKGSRPQLSFPRPFRSGG